MNIFLKILYRFTTTVCLLLIIILLVNKEIKPMDIVCNTTKFIKRITSTTQEAIDYVKSGNTQSSETGDVEDQTTKVIGE